MKQNNLNMLESFKFLWRYAKKHKRNFSLFYLGWLVESFLEALSPILIALMIDEVVYYKNLVFFCKISLVFVVSSTFACILFFTLYTIHHYLMSMYTFDIKSAIFNHAQKVNAAYMSDAKAGNIMKLINEDTVACMHIIIRNLFHFINGILKVIFYFAFTYFINYKLGLLMTLTIPFLLFINRKYGRRMREQSSELKNASGIYTSWVYEILKGLREIKLLSAEKIVLSDFLHKFKDITKIKIRTSLLNIQAAKLVDGVRLSVDLLMYLLVGYLALHGEITLGIFVAVVEFYNRANNQMKFLSENNMDMHIRLASIARIHDFLSEETEASWEGKEILKISKGEIAMSGISFSYTQGPELLCDINLNIEGGSHISLAGTSGSGKTTLTNLLLGFYKPDSGQIYIDGTDISKCTLKSIRQNIGIVSQEVIIFEDTLRSNLKMGNPSATDEEILSACDYAAIGAFIRKLPDGLDTIVGREGIGLSGGQKQRLSIARIYLKNPKILILDEATSALDNESEQVVLKAWEHLSQNRTTITIAHRLSTILKSQKVALLKDGRIVNIGTHEELSKDCRYYKEMFENQLQEVSYVS